MGEESSVNPSAAAVLVTCAGCQRHVGILYNMDYDNEIYSLQLSQKLLILDSLA